MVKLLTVFSFLLTGAAAAHEPVFAPGPHVPGQGIWGVELENTYMKEHELEMTLHYGPAPDSELAYKLYMHWDEHQNGLGDMGLQFKNRFWRRDEFGAQSGAALVAALNLPTGDRSHGFGRGAYGARLGLTFGTEQWIYSGWSAAEFGIKDLYSPGPGRAEWGGLWVRLSVIGGRRFYQPRHYRDWDLPVYLSAHYYAEGPQRYAGETLADTGRQTITIGPSILPSKYFVMGRLGVQFPIWERRRGNQMKTPAAVKFVMEVHF